MALEHNVLGKEVLIYLDVSASETSVCVRIVLSSIFSLQLALKEAEQHTAIALALSNKNAVEAKNLADHNVQVVHASHVSLLGIFFPR